MNAATILRVAFAWGPLLFGIGFVAPVCAQGLEAASIHAPLGLSSLQFGLGVGLTSGLLAKFRGRGI